MGGFAVATVLFAINISIQLAAKDKKTGVVAVLGYLFSHLEPPGRTFRTPVQVVLPTYDLPSFLGAGGGRIENTIRRHRN